MSWHRGFIRVFVVIAIGWAIFVLLILPPVVRHGDWHHYEDSAEDCRKVMTQMLKDGASSESAMKFNNSCTDFARYILDRDMGEHSLNAWLTWKEGRVLALIGFVFLPPWVAYGLFRIGWFALAWVLRGFQPPVS